MLHSKSFFPELGRSEDSAPFNKVNHMIISGMPKNPFKNKMYWTDPYRSEQRTRVLRHVGEDGLILEQSIFYPEGGGQPADIGVLASDRDQAAVVAVEQDADTAVVVRLSGSNATFPIGTPVVQHIDWDRRHRHMRVHTALHLLTVILPYPVMGGQISVEKGRLDFNMPALQEDKAEIEERLNVLASRGLAVSSEWITEDAFVENSHLVKTQMVQPPVLEGTMRLIRIGSLFETTDLQPCGGTHVSNTSEIGHIRLGKIENKGRNNRRVIISID